MCVCVEVVTCKYSLCFVMKWSCLKCFVFFFLEWKLEICFVCLGFGGVVDEIVKVVAQILWVVAHEFDMKWAKGLRPTIIFNSRKYLLLN